MRDLYKEVSKLDLSSKTAKHELIEALTQLAQMHGYEPVETIIDKPWGAMVRFDSAQAENFIKNFFPGLGNQFDKPGELSPKFLLVSPGSRLSWQRHERRAEQWAFLTAGAYHASSDPDDQGELVHIDAGETVQFEQGECHRLVGAEGDTYTLVAEIWQHTDLENPSDEDDIERLADDYKR